MQPAATLAAQHALRSVAARAASGGPFDPAGIPRASRGLLEQLFDLLKPSGTAKKRKVALLLTGALAEFIATGAPRRPHFNC